ncbi:pre-peptidase C-terminal domain-containing protein [Chroococcus sp. FPU101]|uniref:pre-peptidase C-terminal domain-containing protein n=1 Tax=Chroococcus sp. FPU101 TaxID=1974212 RepID=UPI001A8F3CD3|nr:pre-peptidase C-terminal domain-containing protein [Chroococcus sp. FPU101]GFE70786.1 peptidase domain-containing protein [Chroococcus sp. FPU101]
MVTTTYNLGNIGSTVVQRSDYLNTTYHQDVRRFSISGTSNINLHLFGMSADGDDADLRLYRDSNNNGYLDSSDQFLSSSSRGGNGEDSINYQAGAGNYLAVVDRYALGSDQYLPYRINLSAAYGASNQLPNETSVGNLNYDRTFYDYVGSTDTTDTYSFSLSFYEGVNIRLTGLSSDADIRLIRDSNNNRIVDSGEVLRSSTLGGTSSDSINNFNDSGNYFLQVYQYSGNTSYAVTFDHYPTSFA